MFLGKIVSKHRNGVGVLVTIAWAGFMVYMLIYGYRDPAAPMKLNEWGDFFAGFFAPIAFLWLVLGYFQQGEELRLQVEELRRSVEHQGQIVDFSRAQLMTDSKRRAEEEYLQTLEARPDIRVLPADSYDAGNGLVYKVECHNKGGSIRDLSLVGNGLRLITKAPQHLDQGDRWHMEFCFLTGRAHVELLYIDVWGRKGAVVWKPSTDNLEQILPGAFEYKDD